jgi:thioredoxin reductase (NADPH)
MKKLVILGSGPAGLTAAVYASRANLEPLVVEGFQAGGQPGGQLMTTSEVENFPGFPEGIMGPDLMDAMRKQAVRFGTELEARDIDRVDFTQRPFRLWSGNRETQAHAVIIATGASAKTLDLPSVKAFWQKGVSACATCDGALPPFRNQVLAVIGGGDTAIEEAVFLTRFGSKVALIHRRDQFRASKIMQNKALTHPKVEVIFDTVLEEVTGGEVVTGLKLRNVKTNALREYPCRGLFLAIGHQPNTRFLGKAVALDDNGYITVRHPTTYTSVDGVFACGDVTDPHYRQAITSAGSGCIAALDAERWLADRGLG